MNRKYAHILAVMTASVLTLQGFGLAAYAEEEEEITGSLGFAAVSEEDAYVNVRAEASTESGEVIGILQNGDSAVIESVEDDGWYRIRSGEVEGYVASWLIATGEEAEQIAAQTGYTYARVHAQSLNVRSGKDAEAQVVASLEEGAEAEVVEDYDGGAFVRVCVDADTYGYVSADYVELVTDYPTGELIGQEDPGEEEAALTEDASAGSADAGYSETASDGASYTETASAETSYTETSYSETASTEASYTETASTEAYYAETASTEASYTETASTEASYTEAASTEASYTETASTEASYTETASTEASYTETASSGGTGSSTGAAAASYACQFVGNPYVWGGTSLTEGADCSGFTLSVFANYGVSLPHDAASQYGCGTPVSISDLAAGDLVFFSSSGGAIDHVGIYVGSGSYVHAANASSGICYGSLSYSTPVAACRVV